MEDEKIDAFMRAVSSFRYLNIFFREGGDAREGMAFRTGEGTKNLWFNRERVFKVV